MKPKNPTSYDGGQFTVVASGVTYTANAIKFKMTVQIVKDNPFRKAHRIKLEYTDANGNWQPYGSGYTPFAIKLPSESPKGGKVQSVAAATCKVRATVGGVSSTLTIASTIKPAKPTLITYKYRTESRVRISVTTGRKGNAVPTDTLQLYRQQDNNTNSWEAVGEPKNAYGTVDKTTIEWDSYFDSAASGHRYRYGVAAINQAGSSGMETGTDWLYMAPSAASDVAVERVNDYDILISYRINPVELGIDVLKRAKIVRWDDEAPTDSAPTTVGIQELSGDLLNPQRYYHDKTAKPNHKYRYGVLLGNDGDGLDRLITTMDSDGNLITVRYGGRYTPEPVPTSGTEAIYTSPGAPYNNDIYKPGVYATYLGNGDIDVIIDNTGTQYSTKTIIERSTDKKNWEQVAELDTSQEVMHHTDNPLTTEDHYWYRAYNVNDGVDPALQSSYTTMINPVLALATPNPPGLKLPLNNAKLLTSNTVWLEWEHNSNDGTGQTYAEIEIRRNDLEPEYILIEGSSTAYELDTSGYYPDDTITWTVHNKGEYDGDGSDDDGWSNYADPPHTFRMIAPPSITINEPTDNYELSTMPLHLDLDYTDYAGELQSMLLQVMENGLQVYREYLSVGDVSQSKHEYDITGFLFENEKSYDLVITAKSTTGFEVSATITVAIQYDDVQFIRPWYPDVDVDTETGIVAVTVNEAEVDIEPDSDEETEYIDKPVVGATLYRNTLQGREKIADNIMAGEQYIDYYAPLNQPYAYELVMKSKEGRISVMTQDNEVNTNYWYVYWGPNRENICRAIWNPNGDISLERPEKELIRYSGRQYPVSYDSSAMEETFSYSGIILDRAELNNFIAMVRNGGIGVWHSANGEAYDASFKFGYSADFTQSTLRWNCKLDVTRIEA